jgi:hypothetical protein
MDWVRKKKIIEGDNQNGALLTFGITVENCFGTEINKLVRKEHFDVFLNNDYLGIGL